MKISCCMIVRDEEALLSVQLPKMKKYFDEVIIVDNNSTDNTVAVAKSLGCIIINYLKEDFDKGRNEYIKAANGDWIFVIDADERILEDDLEKMKAVTRDAKEEVGAYFLPRIEYLGEGKWGMSYMCRLFRRNDKIRYNNSSIHASILGSVYTNGFVALYSDIYLHHYDLLLDKRKNDKRNNYTEKILKEIEDIECHTEKLYLLLMLGLEYTAIFQYEKANEQYERYCELCDKYSVKKDVIVYLYWAQNCLADNQVDKARQIIENVFEKNFDESDLAVSIPSYILKAEIYGKMSDYNNAVYYIQKAMNLEPLGAHHYINLANMYDKFHRYDEKKYIELYQKAITLNSELNSIEIYKKGKKQNLFLQQRTIIEPSKSFVENIIKWAKITDNKKLLLEWNEKLELIREMNR